MIFPTIEKQAGNKFYLTGEGQTEKGVFRGQPAIYKKHWVNTDGNNTKVRCPGKGCLNCSPGDRGSFEFSINFIHKNSQTGEFQASIYEGNIFDYEKLKALSESSEVLLEDLIVLVSKLKTKNPKNGQPMLTYHFAIDTPLSDNNKILINAVPLLEV